jgi:ribosome maturation factor RimP
LIYLESVIVLALKNSVLDELIRPVVEGLGYECWGIELVSQGKQSVLRIYIDSLNSASSPDTEESESGIGLQDCEKVSRQISGILDVEDPIAGEYTLEVSSPGLDRSLYTLNQFERYAGHKASIKLRMAFEGQRKFVGILNGIEGNDIVLVAGEGEFLFPVESIEKAKVIPQFD